ncbi:MAG: hypothetical protein PHV59_10160, partial [Victivallales bacterium]|nr:hypothetical protein [Victivallales bacterium]
MKSALYSIFSLVLVLVLFGCYSGHSLRVTRGNGMVRERGFIQITPIRMTEVSGGDLSIDLDTFQDDEKAFDYIKDATQENRISHRQKSRTIEISVGKPLGDDTEASKAADFDSDSLGSNSTKASYSDLIELVFNSQMLANGLIRRFSEIKAPGLEYKIYCIPIDITFY